MGLDVSKVVQPAVRGRDDVLVAAFLLMGNTTFRHPVEASVSPEGGLLASARARRQMPACPVPAPLMGAGGELALFGLRK